MSKLTLSADRLKAITANLTVGASTVRISINGEIVDISDRCHIDHEKGVITVSELVDSSIQIKLPWLGEPATPRKRNRAQWKRERSKFR